MSSTLRVLVIDDDADIRRILEIALVSLEQWQVTCTASGEAGVAAFEEGAFDVVLLDVTMPGLDGPATLRRLRAVPGGSEVTILFLTARVQAADRARYERMEVDGLLEKPFDVTRLGASIRGFYTASS